MPIAAWLSPFFLIRFFRNQDRWYKALLALPVLAVAGAVNKMGAWDIDLPFQVVLSVLVTLPMLTALYLDRFFARRLRGVPATLVFPAAAVVLDFAFGLWPLLGTIVSPAATQFELTSLAQVVAVTAVWT